MYPVTFDSEENKQRLIADSNSILAQCIERGAAVVGFAVVFPDGSSAVCTPAGQEIKEIVKDIFLSWIRGTFRREVIYPKRNVG